MKKKIGIVGCGAIGSEVALYIDKNLKSNAVVWALADLDKKKAAVLGRKLRPKVKVCDIDTLIKNSDLVVEAASVKAAEMVLKKAVAHCKDTVILSVGALAESIAVVERAKKKGVNIYIPSGAICGADGLGALSMGHIKSIILTTSKPPKGLIGADYLKKNKINLNNLKKEKVIFKGSVAQAIRSFPKNINVAATMALAASFDNVQVCIKADPKLNRNTHTLEVEAREAKVKIRVENVPSKANPKTSALAILSTQRLLKKIFSSFKVGS